VPDEIKASDLVALMGVVGAAAGLYNALELTEPATFKPWSGEYEELGNALRTLGLVEVQADGG
jgi:hypothetical protein